MMTAAAPSLMPDALPAVTVPSLLNAGLSAASDFDGRAVLDEFVAYRRCVCLFS